MYERPLERIPHHERKWAKIFFGVLGGVLVKIILVWESTVSDLNGHTLSAR